MPERCWLRGHEVFAKTCLPNVSALILISEIREFRTATKDGGTTCLCL